MSLRENLKSSPVKYIVVSAKAIHNQHNFLQKIGALTEFFATYRAFKHLEQNPHFPTHSADIYARLFDNSGEHKLDPVYFYQNAWCAKKIFDRKPVSHYDIGSHVSLISIIAQFTPTTMVDIRPLPLELPGLNFVTGNITALPFKDGAITSLSSICVIEHIGLGRYGDPLDPFGSEKAAQELSRVLAPRGDLYVTVPIDSQNRVYFNAHRAFTPAYIREIFSPLNVVEETYLYGKEIVPVYAQTRGFGTGFFHFKK